jgi:predicted alpha/beta hydrolase family esterase
MKQLIFIHGGEVFATYDDYFAWLRDVATFEHPESESRMKRWHRHLHDDLGSDWDFIRPSMPSSQNAKYDEWKIWFKKVEPFLKDGCVLVGHSLGANFLAKYIEDEDLKFKPASLHLVAGSFSGTDTFSIEGTLEEVTWKVPKIYIYHSKDDPVVPFSDALKYQEHLSNAELISFEDRGHFLGQDFPELVEHIAQSFL